MKDKNTAVKYLIIGNSAGGIGAAEAIRQVDKKGSLFIVSDEPYPAYSRPLISHHLAEGRPLEKMLFRPADFYEQNAVQTMLGSKAQRLDVAAHTVELEGGRIITWEKLLLATGGLPIVPPIKSVERDGVFTFTTLDDAKAIDRFLDRFGSRARRAVVIGGGLIGVSATEALVKRGIAVTIVEMKDHILNVMLDETASAIEEAALLKAGVHIITGRTVAEIRSRSNDMPDSAVLDDGTAVPCDLVIVAIGVRPRAELAAGAGIAVNRGITVDRSMRTSSPDVYACGDAAEAYDIIYGERRLTPIWPNAYLGGIVAGSNMAGGQAEYPGGTAMNSLKYFGVDVVSAGMVNPPDDSYEVISQRHNDSYHKVILKDGWLAGMVFAGNIENSGIAFGLMRDRVNVSRFKSALVAEDFGLASLPERIWQPCLEMRPRDRVLATATQELPEEPALGE
ncbi:MAG: FAD-dependent oxidoreductase [Chloroflexota bacterium]